MVSICHERRIKTKRGKTTFEQLVTNYGAIQLRKVIKESEVHNQFVLGKYCHYLLTSLTTLT